LKKIYTFKFKNDRNQVQEVNVSEETDIRLLAHLIEKYTPREYLNDSGGYEISLNISRNGNEKNKQNKPTGIILEQSRPFIPENITTSQRKWFDDRNIKISSTKSTLVISEIASEEAAKITDWGKKTRNNINEQMGLLIGHIYANDNVFVGWVSHFILSETWGNRISIDVGHSEWADMQKKIEQLNNQYQKEYRIVGWWHTHPEMQLFLSQTDIETQKKFFGKNWQFAMVINPQHRKSCAYCGGNPIKEANLIVMPSNNSKKFE